MENCFKACPDGRPVVLVVLFHIFAGGHIKLFFETNTEIPGIFETYHISDIGDTALLFL